MKYYVKNDGKIYGPADEAKIRSKIAEGFFSRECLVSVDRIAWTKPVSERSGAAKARSQQSDQQSSAQKPPELIMPHLASEDELPPLDQEYPEASPQRKRRFPVWWIVLIVVLACLVGVIAFLAVDYFLLDRQLASWLWNLLD